MITSVSMNSINRYNNIKANNVPSFSMARLTAEGREGAKLCGYQKHEFLDQRMFRRPSIFDSKSRLAEKLEKHADFAALCEIYGCTKDGLNNAYFIENQVFHKKSAAAIANVPEDTYKEGMKKLYYMNFDNPNLSVQTTRKLLESVKDFISLDEYYRASGILESGTINNIL